MKGKISALLAALSALWIPLAAFAQEYAEAGPYRDHGWGWGWGHMLFGSVMMILFWGGLILAVVLAVRWLGAGHGKAAPRRTSLEILEERFARGEMDKEDFEERKRLLSD